MVVGEETNNPTVFTLESVRHCLRPLVKDCGICYVMSVVCRLLLFGDIAENLKQMIPNHLYGRDEETLVRCVYVSECRAEAYHVEIGVTFGEETAFQAGVYAEYARFFAEEFAVGVDRNLH